MGSETSNIDVSPWLKSLPIAPEYHPTLAEFQDPISYIFKIEKEASKFGICKIVPPISQPSKKSILANFNSSLLARDPQSGPTFTTRQQQVGFCPRKHRPVRKPVWQSGERYNLSEFETKAKNFEKVYLKKYAKKVLNPLEMETLYWNATVDKPFSVEYANDMPGSAFSVKKSVGGKKGESVMNVGDSEWNMRGVSRANTSLLKFMKEEIPGVTSPMVYVAMMFSWFAWHVEDHDLHSLNYLHMGASKTWYGVPRDAAVAFEDVIREHGYCGEINPLVTFATLGEKTTVMSPEVLLSAGVPCCRLVQNAGDFVVTFPRAYHSGFSHGFNCGEAANIATPEWLRVAKEAAVRRASINCSPMVSHFQLLYDLTLSLYSRVSKGISMEPRSSRLKDKKKSEGEMLIKELFFHDMVQNNEKLHVLGKGSSVVLLSQNSLSDSTYSNSLLRQQLTAKSNLFPSLCSPDLELTTTKYNPHGHFMVDREQEIEQASNTSCSGNNTQDTSSDMKRSCEKGLFSCVACGILCFSCVAILQPTEEASRNLMSADSSKFDDDWGVSVNDHNCNYVSDSNAPNMNPYSVLELLKNQDGLYSVPMHRVTNVDKGSSVGTVSNSRASKGPSSLNLLALAYGDSSDSEAEADIPENHNSGINCGSVSFQQFSSSDARDRDFQSLDSSDEFRKDNCTALESNSLIPHRFRNQNRLQSDTLRFTDGDSSRLHVFCLEHAVQVEKRLSSIGGAHIFLVCHPDYPKLESQAKKVAEELESHLSWNNISFREATEDDEDMIRFALHSESAMHGNGDWAVKLGVNLFYSANLSRSPLYCKQMPYNSIIYNAFGRGLENESEIKVSSRQRKIVVAGKWCGKVWMSNQVHPLLVKKEFEEEEQNFGVELIKPDLVYERRAEGNRALEMGKTSGKGKIGAENGLPFKESPETQNGGDICQDFALGRKYKRERRAKQVKKEFRQVDHLDSSSEEVEYTELPKKIKGRRGGKRLKGEMESLEEYLKKFPLSKSWKVIKGKNGARQIKETIPEAEQCDESSEECQPVNSRKKIRLEQLKDENMDESSEETPLCDSWNQIKSKAKRMKMNNPEKSGGAEKPLDDELAGGPSTRLRKRKTKLCKDSVTISVNVKPVPKQRPKERITKKVVPANSNSARIRDEEGEYQCDMEGCTMSFGSKNELTAHKRNVCPVKGCGKKFFSHKYLVQHRRVHEDDRPLKCPWKGCKMTFKWAWARTEHIRVHTGARPYVCTQAGCGQTFRFVSDFSRHKRKTGHTPKKSKVKRGG